MPTILAFWEAQVGRLPELSSLRPARENKKLAQCGHMSLFSHLLERLRQENCSNLGCRSYSEPRAHHTPLHSSLGDRVRLHLKKKK